MLASIALADMVFTSVGVALGRAWEANPLMAWILREHGPFAFVALKAGLIAVPLSIAELARARYPATVVLTLRAAIVAYAVLWLWGTAVLNRWL